MPTSDRLARAIEACRPKCRWCAGNGSDLCRCVGPLPLPPAVIELLAAAIDECAVEVMKHPNAQSAACAFDALKEQLK